MRFDDPVMRRRVGGAAWGIGLVGALAWSVLGTGSRDGVGYGFAPPIEVSAAETARLAEVPVTLHQRVAANDVVARLDASLLAAERARAVARLPLVSAPDDRRPADGSPLPVDPPPGEGHWPSEQGTLDVHALDLRIDSYDLRAWIDGEVSWIYKRPGEVVAAGQPVLQIRPVGTREVVAYLSPREVVGLEPGSRAVVRRATGQVVHGELVSVGAGPQAVPDLLWNTPSWPEYGVPVRLRVESEIGPDEAVSVHL